MRTVALEEHLTFPELTSRIPKELMANYSIDYSFMMNQLVPRLADISDERIRSMNENGITVQILSVAGAGADLLDSKDAPAFAKQYNDAIAEKITGYPDRFSAFAHLPMTNAPAAADELERTVKTYGFKGALINGLTRDKFLDDPEFAPVLQRAELLDVPIYLHPGLPPKTVADAYYSKLPRLAGMLLSIAGWGWHSETAIHVLRLIISGTFDRYPKLKLIIGHMGEMLPMMMVRCDRAFIPEKVGVNRRSVIDTLREQVMITTSGIFTNPPLVTAIDTFGIDNIMFSVDYPFGMNEQGKEFLDNIPLPVDQVEKIAHRNADKLLKLTA
ncbi:MAG TPA: amidohydrolase family protein [Puia sp.]|nr:amidohydrolase family protein [Puia sp.]